MSEKSPLTGGRVKKIKSIPVIEIKKVYQKLYPEVRVNHLLNKVSHIELFECLDSSYKYFKPFNIAGDGLYYEDLGKLPWYYSSWKKEHQMAAEHIADGAKVLEVGAAKGSFLKKLKEIKGADVTGLELNPESEKYGKENGINILNESIEDHARNNENKYDVVISFQVLEHITEVGSFIEAMIKSLKLGGMLIIAVPNNDSYLKNNLSSNRILNMPPHHMGLWSKLALESLANFFPLKHINTEIEPLQPIHEETYVMSKFYSLFHYKLLVTLLWKIGFTSFMKPILLKNRKSILGHTIITYYEKTN